ncbi:putative disease resistance protein At3g14460 isoform X1 [Tasmannia lanceolata]
MHDLMHDLAESISGDECLRMEHDMSRTIPKTARHLSWILDKENPISSEVLYKFRSKFKSLRSFQVNVQPPNRPPIIIDALMELTCLRVLNLGVTQIKELPDSIGNLKHLRYLDISHTKIDRLPESVTNLCNLQTLRLATCKNHQGISTLPKGITNLVNLRHIEVDQSSLDLAHSICLPGIGKLTSLQTLPTFIVSKESGCQIGELKNMRNIKGRMGIRGLRNVQNIEEAKEANLKGKIYLNQLVLEWDRYAYSKHGIVTDEIVMEGLQPHANLKKLHIDSYGGVSFPSWIGHLINLTIISFGGCLNCKHLLPPNGHLPCLRELHLEECPSLQAIPKANVLPALTKLDICDCQELSTLPMLSSLRHLELWWCDEKILSSSVPCLTSLSILTINGFKSLRLLPHGLLKPLTALQSLTIDSCSTLECWSKEDWLQDLPRLQHLMINGCKNLVSLANGDGGLPTTLKTLKISDCSNLNFMPTRLENLTSLKEMKIHSCPKLHSLFPDDDNNDYSLPTTLEHLEISYCRKLEERCREEGGQDWPKIQRIPHINIDDHRPGRGVHSPGRGVHRPGRGLESAPGCGIQ